MIEIIAPLLFAAAAAASALVISTTLIPALPRIIELLSKGNRP